MEIKRTPSGIYGLDEHIEGGFPLPSVILVLGEPGAGKTTFAMQVLFKGAELGQNVLYITGVSEPLSMIRGHMSRFSFYDTKYIEGGVFRFWDLKNAIDKLGPRKALVAIKELITKTNSERIVIDPLTFFYMFDNEMEYRKYLYEFFDTLRRLNALTILVGEKPPSAAIEIEGYMVDGIIVLTIEPLEENKLVYKNRLRIRKLRGTNHTRDVLSVEITRAGMRVYRID